MNYRHVLCSQWVAFLNDNSSGKLSISDVCRTISETLGAPPTFQSGFCLVFLERDQSRNRLEWEAKMGVGKSEVFIDRIRKMSRAESVWISETDVVLRSPSRRECNVFLAPHQQRSPARALSHKKYIGAALQYAPRPTNKLDSRDPGLDGTSFSVYTEGMARLAYCSTKDNVLSSLETPRLSPLPRPLPRPSPAPVIYHMTAVALRPTPEHEGSQDEPR